MRRTTIPVAILLALAGCVRPTGDPLAPAAPAATRPAPRAAASEAPRPVADPAGRPVGPGAIAATLVGKAKLLSEHGAGMVVTNQGGGLLSKVRGAGLVANNGDGLVAAGGGDLLSKVRFALAQAAPAGEALLADADVELLDGEGRPLVGEDGAPLRARTDETGTYRFAGKLPDENLVARVRLWNGGELLAVLARGSGPARTLDLDTASTLGTSYVLERFVLGRRAVYGRLPAAEAEGLRHDMETARGRLGPAIPTYRPADMAAAAETLRVADEAVGRRLARIKALLVVGQADMGEDLPATRVPLAGPGALAGDAAGNLFVAEYFGGRVRRVAPGGTLHRFLGAPPRAGQVEGDLAAAGLQGPSALAMAPDGTLYVADELGHRVLAVAGGKVRVVAGTGRRAQGPAGGAGPTVALMGPNALAVGPDGRLWIGEDTKQARSAGRLLVAAADGTIQADEAPPAPGCQLGGLAFTPDGALWALDVMSPGGLWRRPPGGAWARLAASLAVNDGSRIVAAPDGGVFVAEQRGGRVSHVAADGARTTVAGAEAGSPLVAPTGLWLDGAGTLYVADLGAGQVLALAPPYAGAKARVVAGTAGVTQQGDALTIAINMPGGMTLDGAGRLVFTETGGHLVKRLDGGALTVLAGTLQGFGGDGGPAIAARLDAPTGVARAGDDLYVLDAQNERIRRIAADGTITTAVGAGQRGGMDVPRLDASRAPMRRPTACALAPDGRLYWVDNENAQVCRLNGDGTVELVAGQNGRNGADGDGGPAAAALLDRPTTLAFDAQGDLYVADAGNGRIRKITGLGGPTPRIEAFIGVGLAEALGRLAEPEPVGPVPGDRALLVGLTGLAFDARGDLYVAEVGTARLAVMLASSPLGALLEAVPSRGARIRKVTGIAAGRPLVETIAGPGTGILDAPGTDDSLVSPVMLLVDPARGLFVMDTGNNTIRLLPRGAY